MRYLVFFALLTLALPAFAAGKPELEYEVCRLMIAHEPAPDVAYKPGLDVQGRPVIEADIAPSPVAMPESISFDVTVDFAQYIGLQVPAGLKSDARIGLITIGRDGRMTFNDKPLEGEPEAALHALCREEPEADMPAPADAPPKD
jgi:hypothetical protein